MTQDTWNVWDVIQLVVGVLMPLLALGFGYFIHKKLKSIEQQHWQDRTATEWRIRVFDEVSPQLHSVYSYLVRLNHWRDLTPDDVIQAMRGLDRRMASDKALFSQELMVSYKAFMEACFKHFRAPDLQAGIRAEAEAYRRALGKRWERKWDSYFVEADECALVLDVEHRYKELMVLLSDEMQISLSSGNHLAFASKLCE